MAGTGIVDAVVAVSERGTSAETVEALQAVELPRLVVTDGLGSPLARLADAVVPLGLLEDSPVYTLGFTGTLQALGLLAAALGGEPAGRTWDALPHLVETTLETAVEAVAALVDRIGTPRGVDFVGSGPHLAAALEGSLLLREASRLPTSCHSTHQYLHGPMEPLDERQLAVVIGDGREIALAFDIAATGAQVLLVTTARVTAARQPHGDPGAGPRHRFSSQPSRSCRSSFWQTRPAAKGSRWRVSGTSNRHETGRWPYRRAPGADNSSTVRTGALGIDIGGSKLAVASGDRGAPASRFFGASPTPSRNAGEVRAAARELVERAVSLADDHGVEIAGIGVAVPEVVGLDGRILSQAVVPGLDGDEWVRQLGAGRPDRHRVRCPRRRHGRGTLRGGPPAIGPSASSAWGPASAICHVEDGVVHAGAHGAAILLGSSVTAEWEVDGGHRRWVLEELASGRRCSPGTGISAELAQLRQRFFAHTATRRRLLRQSQRRPCPRHRHRPARESARSRRSGRRGRARKRRRSLLGAHRRFGPGAHLGGSSPATCRSLQAELDGRSAAVGAALIGWDRADRTHGAR